MTLKAKLIALLAILVVSLLALTTAYKVGAAKVQHEWDLDAKARATREEQASLDREAENKALKAQYEADRALQRKQYNAKLSDYSERLRTAKRLRLGSAWDCPAGPPEGAVQGPAGSDGPDPDNRVAGADLQRFVDRFKERLAAGFETGRLAQEVIIKNGLDK